MLLESHQFATTGLYANSEKKSVHSVYIIIAM